MKNRAILAIILSIQTAFTVFGSENTNTSPEKTSASSTSWELFHSYMNKPLAQNIFRTVQWNTINLKSDALFTNFFVNLSPDLFKALVQAHTKDINKFSMQATVSMMKLRKGITKKYDSIDRIVKKCLEDLGFPEEAIQNREIYIHSGDINAYTVSGDMRRVIVVLQSDLIEKLNESELRAVLSHEFGHIVSLHSIKRSFNSLLMTLCLSLYAKPPEALAAATSGVDTGTMMGAQSDIIKSIAPLFNPAPGYDQFGESIGNSSETASLLSSAFASMQNQSYSDKLKLARVYLQLVTNAMTEMNAIPEAVRYFQMLMEKEPGSPKGDFSEFMRYARVASEAISRSQEASSDRYSASIIPNQYVGSAFAKLLGNDFQPKDREAVLKLILEQAHDFSNNHTERERAPYMGSSHPALVLRVASMLEAPTYPLILFANPFYRLLLLQSQLEAAAKASPQVDTLNESLTKDILDSIEKTDLAGQRNPRFDEFIQYATANLEVSVDILDTAKSFLGKQPQPIELILIKLIGDFENSLKTPSPIVVGLEQRLSHAISLHKPDSAEYKRIEARIQTLKDMQAATTIEGFRKIRELNTVTRKLKPQNQSKTIPMDIKTEKPFHNLPECMKFLMAATGHS